MPGPRRIAVDTNVLIYLAKGTARGRRYARHLEGAVLVVPFAAVAELLLNARRTRSRALTERYWRDRLPALAVIWPDVETCAVWSELTAECQAQGMPREGNDIWIAACALQYDLPLATHNARHFEHVEGLRIIHEPDPE